MRTLLQAAANRFVTDFCRAWAVIRWARYVAISAATPATSVEGEGRDDDDGHKERDVVHAVDASKRRRTGGEAEAKGTHECGHATYKSAVPGGVEPGIPFTTGVCLRRDRDFPPGEVSLSTPPDTGSAPNVPAPPSP